MTAKLNRSDMPLQRIAIAEMNWSYLKQYTRLCMEQGIAYDGKRYKGGCTLRSDTTEVIQETNCGRYSLYRIVRPTRR